MFKSTKGNEIEEFILCNCKTCHSPHCKMVGTDRDTICGQYQKVSKEKSVGRVSSMEEKDKLYIVDENGDVKLAFEITAEGLKEAIMFVAEIEFDEEG